VVILRAGHNRLVATVYLARAGLSVLLLEKNDYIGGATTSQKVFPDYEVYLSRYSYLVSLLHKDFLEQQRYQLPARFARHTGRERAIAIPINFPEPSAVVKQGRAVPRGIALVALRKLIAR